MKHNLIDKLMLILVILAIGTLVLLNLFQPQRPTYSETENRNLATMPEFSIGSLLDGSYFSDVATYFSDTFYQRDRLVSLSKYMDRLKDFSLFGQAEDNFVVIPDANATLPPNTEGDLPTLPTLPTLPPLTAPTTRPTMPTEPTFPVGPTVPTEPTNPTQPTNPTGPTGPANPTEPTEPTQPTPPTTQPPVPVTPLILSADSLSITAGASQALTAIVGEGYTDLTWHSNDASIATVTAVSPDTATVTAVAPAPTDRRPACSVWSPSQNRLLKNRTTANRLISCPRASSCTRALPIPSPISVARTWPQPMPMCLSAMPSCSRMPRSAW